MLLPGIKGRRLEAKNMHYFVALFATHNKHCQYFTKSKKKKFFSIICFGGPREKQKP